MARIWIRSRSGHGSRSVTGTTGRSSSNDVPALPRWLAIGSAVATPAIDSTSTQEAKTSCWFGALRKQMFGVVEDIRLELHQIGGRIHERVKLDP